MKTNPKICILTAGAYPVPATKGGAAENMVEIMAENLNADDCGCSVDIISCYNRQAERESDIYENVRFYFIKYSRTAMKAYNFLRRVTKKLFNYSPVMLNPYFAKALKIIRKNKYDAVIVENAPRFAEPLKKYTDAKVVFHLHNDFEKWCTGQRGKHIEKSDMIMAVSDFVADGVIRLTGHPNVVTVKNVIDIKQFASNRIIDKNADNLRQKLGFKPDDVVCCFVGRLIPEKGIHRLLDAIAKTTNPHIKLLVVGGNAYGDSQKTEFEEKLYEKAEKIKDKIVFVGYVNHDELPAYYRACDIAVFPSLWKEAAGLVVIEAQAAGKPVIISKTGGMPEYVSQESAVVIEKGRGYSDRFAQAVDMLAYYEDVRNEMGRAGAEYAKQFDKNGYFNKISEHIKTVL